MSTVNHHHQVVVVGGGAAGISVAARLRRNKHGVRLHDAAHTELSPDQHHQTPARHVASEKDGPALPVLEFHAERAHVEPRTGRAGDEIASLWRWRGGALGPHSFDSG